MRGATVAATMFRPRVEVRMAVVVSGVEGRSRRRWVHRIAAHLSVAGLDQRPRFGPRPPVLGASVLAILPGACEGDAAAPSRLAC